jgi:DeoR family transcriptional regulator, glycerol-3-phosphate regulon repressor
LKPQDTTTSHSSLREREILDELRLSGGSVRIQFLAERLNVSEETIRRNIRSLELSGHVAKVHGGVHLLETRAEPPLQARMNTNAEAKRRVASAIAAIIHDGDSLFLDIGSTTAFIAMALENHRDLFVVTNSLSVAQSLATRNNNQVYFAGGHLRSHDGGSFGLEAAEFIRRFKLRYAILTVGAINAASGFMLHDQEEAEFSRHASRLAQTRIIAADSAKFSRSAPIILDKPDHFDMLVTDRKPPQDICTMLAANSVQIFYPENVQDS